MRFESSRAKHWDLIAIIVMQQHRRYRNTRPGRVERLKNTLSLKSKNIEQLTATNKGLNDAVKKLVAENKVITRFVMLSIIHAVVAISSNQSKGFTDSE